ncbi:zinc finger BED domain-containing protein RICESLEEPER 2-like protein [Tanacetum coccineum]
MIAWKFDQLSVRRALAYMVIIDELPFKFVEGKGFKHFLNVSQLLFYTLSRITMAIDCVKLYLEEKKKVGSLLRGNVSWICLTTDKWTSLHRINYIHRGVDIGKAVEICLLKWGIESNVFTITIDNATANDVAVTYLKNKLNKFKEYAKIEKCQSIKGLILDVPTRWNSTYLMLETAQNYEKAFSRYDSEDCHYRDDLEKTGVPVSTDWANVRRLAKFLEHFYELTLKVSRTLYVTSNSFLDDITSINAALNNCIYDVRDKNLSVMAKMMKCKFDKYYGGLEKCNIATAVASVLDLRNKL